MTEKEAKYLIDIINDWVFQRYGDVRSNYHGKGLSIFRYLKKYRKDFPSSCFYSGEIKRKMPKGSNCPKKLVACSKPNGKFNTFETVSIYISTTENGFDLLKIVKFLKEEYKVKPEIWKCQWGVTLEQRLNKEKEIICYMNPNNFRKYKKTIKKDSD